MKKSNKLRRMFRAVAVLAATGLVSFTGCTKVDDTLGSNLVPDDQQMKAGHVSLPNIDGLNPRKYVETRLYRTDSIIASNISYGYMGSMLSDTFGLRNAGFLSQYVSYYKVDSGYFGEKPIFDSAQILLSIKSYGTDTLTDQTFAVYKITSNKYLTEKPVSAGKTERDTTFYLNFDPYTANPDKTTIVGEKLFTFTIGQSNNTGPASKAITMTPTTDGREFIRELMLQKGEYEGNYSIYSADSLEQWVAEFKGLYIKPESDQTESQKGTVYATSLEASGFSVYGRTREKDDPTLIKDTIGMVYYFYDSYADHGNVSVNTVVNDYSKANPQWAIPNIDKAVETESSRPETATVYVAGMGGVISEITFTQEFFDDMEALIAKENSASDKEFKTLAFSQAKMSIYFDGSNYNWENLTNVNQMIQQMNAAQSRLGLYTNYKKLTPITDYAYVYEKSYGTELAYGGYVNRSRGCYVMDISGYMQGLWNNYVKLKAETPAGQAIDLSKLENRSIFLGPEAYDLFSSAYSVTQGMVGESYGKVNNAPIRFELTYNMIK